MGYIIKRTKEVPFGANRKWATMCIGKVQHFAWMKSHDAEATDRMVVFRFERDATKERHRLERDPENRLYLFKTERTSFNMANYKAGLIKPSFKQLMSA